MSIAADDGLRNLLSPIVRVEVLGIFPVRDVGKFDQHGRELRGLEHAERRLLIWLAAHLGAFAHVLDDRLRKHAGTFVRQSNVALGKIGEDVSHGADVIADFFDDIDFLRRKCPVGGFILG